MSKPPMSVSGGDKIQSGGNGLSERFAGARTCPPQYALQFGERLFNGRHIRRVRWQKQQAAATGFKGVLHLRPQVDREVIQDDDLPRTQAGSQDLLDVE